MASMARGFRGRSGVLDANAFSTDKAVWLVCYGSNDEWTLLEPSWVTELEAFISAQSQDATLPRFEHWYQTKSAWKSDMYRIDPWAMTQTNCSSGKVRPLIRCIVQAPVQHAPLPSLDASVGGSSSAYDVTAQSQNQETGAAHSTQEQRAATAPSPELPMAKSDIAEGHEWESVPNIGVSGGLERLIALDSDDLLAHMTTNERKILADRLAQIPLV
jgi:hypothetical protein